MVLFVPLGISFFSGEFYETRHSQFYVETLDNVSEFFFRKVIILHSTITELLNDLPSKACWVSDPTRGKGRENLTSIAV